MLMTTTTSVQTFKAEYHLFIPLNVEMYVDEFKYKHVFKQIYLRGKTKEILK